MYLLGCSSSKHGASSIDSQLKPYIDSIAGQFAPDQRTVLFTVQAKAGVLKGETTSAAAKHALVEQLSQNGLPFIDSIVVLPSASLRSQITGIISISVANLRTQPSHRAELATQATMGTFVKLWKKERGWYLAQTPDNYLAWVDGDAITQQDEAALLHWQHTPKLIYVQPYGFAYDDTSAATTVSDLVYGSMMTVEDTLYGYYSVIFPDGRKAYVPKQQSMLYNDWKQTRQPTPSNIIQASKKLLGVPYLWGGTSFKGVDCSGFTKTVYFMNGIVLPRDASQQALLGEVIDTTGGWKNLLPGDLLFFGTRARNDRAEQVVHVGLWLGNNEFIHASGMVRIASIDPSAANYDANEHKRFLRAKRIPSPPGTR